MSMAREEENRLAREVAELNGLPPQLTELLRKVKHWDADRQRAEYEQAADEAWDALDMGAYTLLSNLARAMEDLYPGARSTDWRGTALL